MGVRLLESEKRVETEERAGVLIGGVLIGEELLGNLPHDLVCKLVQVAHAGNCRRISAKWIRAKTHGTTRSTRPGSRDATSRGRDDEPLEAALE